MSEIPRQFIEAAEKLNPDGNIFTNDKMAWLYVEKGKILSLQKIEGVNIKAKQIKSGVKVYVEVEKGRKIKEPIFLCFEILSPKGKQIVFPEIILRQNSRANILANCIFPEAENILHQMKAKIILEKNARLDYLENHYHGENYGANVQTGFKVQMAENSFFENKFSLIEGSVGKLNINLDLSLEDKAFSQIFTKVIGRGRQDKVEIIDNVFLKGKESRSVLRMKGVAVNGGNFIFKGNMTAGEQASRATGHIDCQEIVVGRNSKAVSIPMISVVNPEARITHEASVGKINQKELETLMSRGLSEKEAIDFIIRGRIK